MTTAQIKSDFKKNKYIYLMILPVAAYYLLFHYGPMYGAVIAFKDFNAVAGILGSPWVGIENFSGFFSSVYFPRLMKNTVLLSFYGIVWGFPAPILLALLLNEIRNVTFKRTVQTITYLPHFISLVVVCGIIIDFTSTRGIINDLLEFLSGKRVNLLMVPGMFRSLFIGSGIWQEVGWGSIIYLAAIAGIDQEQYEAAIIDGAGRWKQMLHVTLPGIAPTIVILLILRLGGIMNVGFEKVILLYNPTIMDTADVISSYVYRRGLLDADYSFSSAVGLFNSVINFILLVLANRFSKAVSETSLW